MFLQPWHVCLSQLEHVKCAGVNFMPHFILEALVDLLEESSSKLAPSTLSRFWQLANGHCLARTTTPATRDGANVAYNKKPPNMAAHMMWVELRITPH